MLLFLVLTNNPTLSSSFLRQCAPPPADDAVTCPDVPECPCGFVPEVAIFPDEEQDICCPSYQCVVDTAINNCDCVECPTPPPCACPGYEPVPVVEPTLRGNDCCPIKYNCEPTDRAAYAAFAATCETADQFYVNNITGCGSNCEFEVRLLEEASPKNDVCCPSWGCKPLRRPKCCTTEEVDACPPVDAACECPQLTRIVVRPAEPLEGRCCPVTDCVDLGLGSAPDCSIYEPLCADDCKEPVVVKRASPAKGRCCDIKKCQRIDGCAAKKGRGGGGRRRRRRGAKKTRRNRRRNRK